MADVLDAFAVVALARDEPAAAEVEAVLRRGEALITATNLGEALDQLHRVHGESLEGLATLVETLTGEGVSIVAVDPDLIWRAIDLRARHYRRRTSTLSLADCVALAAARPGEDRLATGDAALVTAAQTEGVACVALPASDGRRPRT